MALLFMSGFEEEDWSIVFATVSGFTVSTDKPRTGTRSIMGNGIWDTGLLSGSSTQMTAGIAIWIPPVASSWHASSILFKMLNGSGQLLAEFQVNSLNGSVRWVNDIGAQQQWSGPGVRLAYGAWNFVEAAFDSGSYPTGSCKAWLNGESVIDGSFTRYNNYDGTITQVREPGWGIGNSADVDLDQRPYLDDLYIRTGMIPYGDTGILRMHVTGAGSATTWTATGSATNWQCVDDVNPDDDTTYVYSSVVGAKDLYALENVTITGDIYAVAMTIRGKKTSSGTRAVRALIKSTSEANGRTLYLPSSGYKTDFHSVFETKPTGGVWTQAALDALEAGIELTV